MFKEFRRGRDVSKITKGLLDWWVFDMNTEGWIRSQRMETVILQVE